jgi:hypothetical protein
MHKLDLVRGQGNDTINGDNADCDAIAGAKIHRDAERGGG